jgi:hypothetical protein
MWTRRKSQSVTTDFHLSFFCLVWRSTWYLHVSIGRFRANAALPRTAAEFDVLAEGETSPNVRLRYRIVARHYRELAEREEQSDKARLAERIKRLKLQREASAQAPSPDKSDGPLFLIAAE